MKKLLLFVLATVAFAACEQAPIEEAQGVMMSDRSLEVSFEGADDTRIQLQNGKTVWTKGDHVSVFYRSAINEEWQFMGETGDRTGQIVPVDNSVNPPATHNHVVVAYPYSADYFYNTETHNVEASLPAVQNYMKDSYGTNGNIMISSSEFNKVSLKSVCGWLKLQLTGDGEVVKSITLRGNDGEQVAGLIYVDSAAATATLASASGEAGDGEVGGTLVRPGTILTEVTLDCSEGVALGKNATAFYIALPPQTFEKGFTLEIEDTEGYVMEQSTDKALIIERNHIQPMAALEFINPNRPSQPNQPIPASNEIWYTSSDGGIITPSDPNVFGAIIISNTYTDGMGIITFNGNVTTIGNAVFAWCESLTSIIIPNSVTTIGDDAFRWCTNLTSFTIPDSVTSIGEGAFCYCRSLTSVTIPNSVTTIGDWAFQWCFGLTSITIPDSVTTIGDYAFEDCRSLTSITIPDSVTSIGEGAFYNCNSLTSVTIPDSVTTIGEQAFSGCSTLTSITIPDSVMTIGNSAFSGCLSLTSITIPDSVTTIGDDAFYGCDRLISVTIGDSVTTIGDNAFYSCDSLTSVNIGDGVTWIGVEAFAYCDSLTEFNGKFASEDGRCLILDGVLNFFAPYGLTEYTIPDSITMIGDRAFAYCDNLTSVTIGDGVTMIGEKAFYECYSLTSVTIGDSVTTIGGDAFYYCTSLTSVNIPDSVTSIGGYAFYFCKSLTSVNIPDSVTTIGMYAFYFCNSLTSVNIHDGVTTIGNSAFSGCYSLTSVTIGDGVTTIGNSAFENCSSMTSVTIPDSVTEIGNAAFRYCSSLTSVTIGDGVTSIGYYAFEYCYSLTSVYCKATTPPSLGGYGVFDYNVRKIYVPTGSVSAYKSAWYWREYASAIVGYNF